MNEKSTWTDEVIRQLDPGLEPWMSCNDCFDQSDEIVEQLIEHATPLPDQFRAHLRGCPACREEAETLAELIASDNRTDPTTARILLDLAIA